MIEVIIVVSYLILFDVFYGLMVFLAIDSIKRQNVANRSINLGGYAN
jgi:hypothetical protein